MEKAARKTTSKEDMVWNTSNQKEFEKIENLEPETKNVHKRFRTPQRWHRYYDRGSGPEFDAPAPRLGGARKPIS